MNIEENYGSQSENRSIIVVGSRTLEEDLGITGQVKHGGSRIVEQVIAGKCLFSAEDVDKVIATEYYGPFQWGKEWASRNNVEIRQVTNERDNKFWRNIRMLREADVLIVFYDGESGDIPEIEKIAHKWVSEIIGVDLSKPENRHYIVGSSVPSMLTDSEEQKMVESFDK